MPELADKPERRRRSGKPGRPWPDGPRRTAETYLRLTPDEKRALEELADTMRAKEAPVMRQLIGEECRRRGIAWPE